MSRPGCAVLVFEQAGSAEPLERLLQDHLRPDSGTDGTHGFTVPDLHCALRANATGYSILTIFFSGNFEYDHPEEYRRFLKKVTDWGKTMGAVFGFISTHDGQLEDKWLENEIICPILAGNNIEQTRIGTSVILLSNS